MTERIFPLPMPTGKKFRVKKLVCVAIAPNSNGETVYTFRGAKNSLMFDFTITSKNAELASLVSVGTSYPVNFSDTGKGFITINKESD